MDMHNNDNMHNHYYNMHNTNNHNMNNKKTDNINQILDEAFNNDGPCYINLKR